MQGRGGDVRDAFWDHVCSHVFGLIRVFKNKEFKDLLAVAFLPGS
jgi:hypothetical protein